MPSSLRKQIKQDVEDSQHKGSEFQSRRRANLVRNAVYSAFASRSNSNQKSQSSISQSPKRMPTKEYQTQTDFKKNIHLNSPSRPDSQSYYSSMKKPHLRLEDLEES